MTLNFFKVSGKITRKITRIAILLSLFAQLNVNATTQSSSQTPPHSNDKDKDKDKDTKKQSAGADVKKLSKSAEAKMTQAFVISYVLDRLIQEKAIEYVKQTSRELKRYIPEALRPKQCDGEVLLAKAVYNNLKAQIQAIALKPSPYLQVEGGGLNDDSIVDQNVTDIQIAAVGSASASNSSAAAPTSTTPVTSGTSAMVTVVPKEDVAAFINTEFQKELSRVNAERTVNILKESEMEEAGNKEIEKLGEDLARIEKINKDFDAIYTVFQNAVNTFTALAPASQKGLIGTGATQYDTNWANLMNQAVPTAATSQIPLGTTGPSDPNWIKAAFDYKIKGDQSVLKTPPTVGGKCTFPKAANAVAILNLINPANFYTNAVLPQLATVKLDVIPVTTPYTGLATFAKEVSPEKVKAIKDAMEKLSKNYERLDKEYVDAKKELGEIATATPIEVAAMEKAAEGAAPAAGTPAAGTPAAGTPAAGTPAQTPAAGTPAAGTPAQTPAGTPAAGTPAHT
jgi:hypothetical protein